MPEMKMDQLSSLPITNNDDNHQREKLFYLLERMRQIQGSTDNQRVPKLDLHSPSNEIQPLNCPGFPDDQPLNFSTKNIHSSSCNWTDPSFFYKNNKQDSLESDGHSLESDSRSLEIESDLSGSRSPDSIPGSRSIDSVDSGAHSPGSDISPRLPQPGSTSPPRPALTSLKIETPTQENSIYHKKPDLLTTVSSLQSTTQNMPPRPHLSLLRPLSSLQTPQVPPPTPEQFNPLLNLAGLASMQGMPHLPSLPIFPQTQNHLQYPLNFTSSPIPPFGISPSQPPLSELAMMNTNSQQKYANFREVMLKNMEKSKINRKHLISNIKSDEGEEEENCSIHLLSSPVSSATSTPISMSSTPISNTPTRMGDNKDDAYWERRRKNNEAAKRSRDSRKLKENEIAVRASYLEQENIQLKMELAQIKIELSSYRELQRHNELAQVKIELGSYKEQQRHH